MINYKDDIIAYLTKLKSAIDNLNIEELNCAMNAITDVYNRHGNIYIFGNGGSAATASHFVCDFNKGISNNKDKKFLFHCLNDNVPSILAIANDIGYDEIFEYQLRSLLEEGDLVIAISGSGNSKNIIKAAQYAKSIGVSVIGITGYNGGKLREIADFFMHVNENDMQISEDLHMVFDHMMMRIFCDRL